MRGDWGYPRLPLEEMLEERNALIRKLQLRSLVVLTFGVGFAIGSAIGWLVFGI
jgi:hypothetical protein